MMPLSACEHEEKLLRDVLGYFLHNPQSADSLVGVAHWRLLDETIHHTLTETKGALEKLVADGYLKKVSASGSDPIYTLNSEKRQAAEQFIKRGDSTPHLKQPSKTKTEH
jgi:hypothetical protein